MPAQFPCQRHTNTIRIPILYQYHTNITTNTTTNTTLVITPHLYKYFPVAIPIPYHYLLYSVRCESKCRTPISYQYHINTILTPYHAHTIKNHSTLYQHHIKAMLIPYQYHANNIPMPVPCQYHINITPIRLPYRCHAYTIPIVY